MSTLTTLVRLGRRLGAAPLALLSDPAVGRQRAAPALTVIPERAKEQRPANARVEHDRALGRDRMAVLKDESELVKGCSANDGLRRWPSDAIFWATCGESA
jgi:hypothetical protein